MAGQCVGAALDTHVRIFIVLSVLKHRFHPDDRKYETDWHFLPYDKIILIKSL